MTETNSQEIYLHIGTEKTGTTTIQRFLAHNRKLLSKQGILHPKCLSAENHTRVAIYADQADQTQDLWSHQSIRNGSERDQFNSKLKEEFQSEVRKSKPQKIILSNEHCSSRLLDEASIDHLRGLLTPFSSNIRVVLYLRRQDEFLLSSYATAIKSGKTTALAVPNVMENNPWVHKRYRYRPLIDRWANVFGKENIVIRTFDRALMHGEDVIEDFKHTLGIETDSFTVPEVQNESMGADVIEFLRMLNSHMPAHEEYVTNPTRAAIVNILMAMPIGKKRSVEELARFMDFFETENNQLAKDFLGRDLLFSTAFPEEKYTTSPDTSPEQMIKIASEVFNQLPEYLKNSSNLSAKASGKMKRFLS